MRYRLRGGSVGGLPGEDRRSLPLRQFIAKKLRDPRTAPAIRGLWICPRVVPGFANPEDDFPLSRREGSAPLGRSLPCIRVNPFHIMYL